MPTAERAIEWLCNGRICKVLIGLNNSADNYCTEKLVLYIQTVPPYNGHGKVWREVHCLFTCGDIKLCNYVTSSLTQPSQPS
jgi:hypothetical protein